MFVSVDIETDGACPGVNSMLSIGAVAYDNDGKELDSFESNFVPLTNGVQNKETMEFWYKQPEAFATLHIYPVRPLQAMLAFKKWLSQYDKPLFVAWPITFDFSFVYYYFYRFLGECPFGYKGFDMYTYACILLGLTRDNDADMEMGLWSKNFPEEWKEGTENPLEHVAINDARSQGRLFFNMRKWEREMYRVENLYIKKGLESV